ncbi:CpaF family protein [Paenibacillus sp. GSMTC-2017]|uniref:CpaF family protein n=1 Tax=Paenibacillus sp. GSMTC-2017 TaxID=2794350 RepID=UPI0018DA2ADF|nr:ATPase, T2SS/T4P/T4SS family [Paenibacillus sp. GSMTC-2017]MBH5317475.1 CpaF family protein [Paenibacillus sp. GSMTC-2017]
MVSDEIVYELRCKIRGKIDFGGAMSDDELMEKTEEIVFHWCEQNPITAVEKVKLVRRLFHSFRGLDILQPLMEDPTVSEIMINSHTEIFVERDGHIHLLQGVFESKERLEDLIQTVVAGVNRVVNESSPIVDARLQDGSRVNVVLPPVALKGPCMTIRKFPDQPMTMEQLVKRGSITEEAALFLQELMEAKFNMFISGGTGTGKTTFLNALSQFIPSDERIVTIEDSAELQIRSVPNLVSMETRNANTEGKGEITIRDLIRTALRMRPNRIVIGEVRGGEALDMLQALNTGHEGSISTGHGNSVKDMVGRLETMVLSAAELPLLVIRQQVASAIDVMIHLSRFRDRTRKVTEISEVLGVVNGEVQLNPLFRFREEGERDGYVVGQLERTENVLQSTEKFRMAGKGLSGGIAG